MKILLHFSPRCTMPCGESTRSLLEDRLAANATSGNRLTTRERQRLDTRERIYAAAIEEFRRVGSANTQIEAIVSGAGVAMGTFYRHFASKDEVLRELQARMVRAITESFLERVALGDRDLEQTLRIYAESVLVDRPGEDIVLEREALALIVRESTPEPDWLESPLFGALTRAFDEAQKQGQVTGDRRPEELTKIFATSVLGFLTGMGVASAERREAAGQFIAVFLRGVSP